MAAVITLEKLTKSYGTSRGIIDVDLEVEHGEIFGFLGPQRGRQDDDDPDDARPDPADVGPRRRVRDRVDADPVAIHRRVGYIPGEFALYDRLTGKQTLEYFANLRGGVDQAYQASLIERFELDPGKRFKEYSKGNKQKVGVIAALQHRPELLVLDEPTSGLDPLVQQTFFETLHEAVADGATVFLSSHILSEVEKSCERVAIIRDGRLAKLGTVDSLRDLAHHQVELRFAGPVPADEFRVLPGVSDLVAEDHTLRMRVAGADHAGRPRRRPVRAARLRLPRAVARGDVPGRVRPRGRGGDWRWPLAPARRGAAAATLPADPAPPPPRTASAASTARRSATRGSRSSSRPACWAAWRCSWAPRAHGVPDAPGAAGGRTPGRARCRRRWSTCSASRWASGTLGGYMTWKYGAIFAMGTALWSIMALSSTLAAEARRGSLDMVATTPLGKQRIAIEKLAAHLTLLWLTMRDPGRWPPSVGSNVFGDAALGDLIPLARRLGFGLWIGSIAMFFGGLAFLLAPVLGRAGSAGVASHRDGGAVARQRRRGTRARWPCSARSAGRSTTSRWSAQYDWLPVALQRARSGPRFMVGGVALFVRRDLGVTAGLRLPSLPAGHPRHARPLVTCVRRHAARARSPGASAWS